MNRKMPLSPAAKVTVAGLLVATLGVLIQILAGVDFPTIPPVLFILLIPAVLIVVARRPWAPVPAILAGVFLSVGLFLSGESARLFDGDELGGSAGLWVQTWGAVVAGAAGALAVINDYRSGTVVPAPGYGEER